MSFLLSHRTGVLQMMQNYMRREKHDLFGQTSLPNGHVWDTALKQLTPNLEAYCATLDPETAFKPFVRPENVFTPLVRRRHEPVDGLHSHPCFDRIPDLIKHSLYPFQCAVKRGSHAYKPAKRAQVVLRHLHHVYSERSSIYAQPEFDAFKTDLYDLCRRCFSPLIPDWEPWDSTDYAYAVAPPGSQPPPTIALKTTAVHTTAQAHAAITALHSRHKELIVSLRELFDDSAVLVPLPLNQVRRIAWGTAEAAQAPAAGNPEEVENEARDVVFAMPSRVYGVLVHLQQVRFPVCLP